MQRVMPHRHLGVVLVPHDMHCRFASSAAARRVRLFDTLSGAGGADDSFRVSVDSAAAVRACKRMDAQRACKDGYDNKTLELVVIVLSRQNEHF